MNIAILGTIDMLAWCPTARNVGYEMCRDVYVFWHIELCAHDTSLARVMRGQSLNTSFD